MNPDTAWAVITIVAIVAVVVVKLGKQIIGSRVNHGFESAITQLDAQVADLRRWVVVPRTGAVGAAPMCAY
jgi:hypothetical protein